MRCLLVDKIVHYETGISITGIKNVTMSENFLEDHFPTFPVMPGVLQAEAVIQLASWLIFATTDFSQKAQLAAIQSIKFKDFVKPGDQMVITVQLTSRDAATASFDARVVVLDKLKTEIKKGRITFIDVGELEDPAAAKKYFQFLTGESPTGGYVVNKGGRFL